MAGKWQLDAPRGLLLAFLGMAGVLSFLFLVEQGGMIVAGVPYARPVCPGCRFFRFVLATASLAIFSLSLRAALALWRRKDGAARMAKNTLAGFLVTFFAISAAMSLFSVKTEDLYARRAAPRPSGSDTAGPASDRPAAPPPAPVPGTSGEILDLVERGALAVSVTGSGIQEVTVRFRPLVKGAISVTVPAGTFFVSSDPKAQNMVTTRERIVVLGASTGEGEGWKDESIPAACANRPKKIPGRDDTFTVRRSPHQEELARLAPRLRMAGENFAVEQAAVWIVTDDASYDDLGILVRRSAYSQGGGSRVIEAADAAEAMRILHEAGIDVTKKQIWRSLGEILPFLPGESWLFGWIASRTPTSPGDRSRELALVAASWSGYLDVVQALLPGMTGPKGKRDKGEALASAAENGHVPVVLALVSAGADADGKGRNDETALFFAARNGHVEVVRELLAAHASVNLRNGHDTPLVVAAENGHAAVVRELLAAKADPNVRAPHGEYALRRASGSGHLEVVRLLLASRANVNAKDGGGETALMAAAEHGHTEIVLALLAARADPNVLPRSERYGFTTPGRTALVLASGNGHLGAVEALLAAKAQVNGSGLGATPLMAASRNGSLDVVRRLLDAGADVRVRAKQDRAMDDWEPGATALLYAVEGGNADVVRALLDAKADPSARSRSGRSPLAAAQEHGSAEMVEMLRRAGAKE